MDPYDELFEKYLGEMDEARNKSETWWESVLADEVQLVGDQDEAERSVRIRWPFGPASHPYIISVYRKYYIACLDLNNKIEEDRKNLEGEGPNDQASEFAWGTEAEAEEEKGPVPPSVFTLDWLFGKNENLRVFLADLVFSPLGIDDLRH